MIRVADYIFKYLADYGVKHVFLVVGGAAMHLNDALKKQKRIEYLCTHHEQGAAIAAEGYSRTKGELSVVSVTSGPGGTNTITGVIGQWLDSVPVLYLSGQAKYETTLAADPDRRLRQLGDQEINIIDIVKPVTKYAKMVIDPGTIKSELDKAVYLATSGRPGPVWLDIPLNVQGALIDERKLKGYKVEDRGLRVEGRKIKKQIKKIEEVIKLLKEAKRPLLIAGHGIRIAKAKKQFLKLVKLLNIPVVSTFNGFDLIPTDSGKFVGRIGTLGSRAGNFALQNSDLIVSLGSRNNIRQVGYDWVTFGKHARKILVDIDDAELHKKTVKGDILLNLDVKVFIDELLKRVSKDFDPDRSWSDWCLVRKKKYPVVLNEYRTARGKGVHPYFFIERLTTMLDAKTIVVAANGTACVSLFQSGIVKSGQRIFWNSGCASMGYGLPAAIGAFLAGNKDVVCIEGDGSIQMNIQELQTIKHNALPIKIFILNNKGYRSIEQTQAGYFKGDFIGCNEKSGVSFPDYSKVADLYNFKYFKIDSTKKMDQKLKNVLSYKGTVICEVFLSSGYIFSPRQSSEKKPDGTMVSKPLENLWPFLDKDELDSNMLVNDDGTEKS